jgi:hypothetical protein
MLIEPLKVPYFSGFQKKIPLHLEYILSLLSTIDAGIQQKSKKWRHLFDDFHLFYSFFAVFFAVK